MKERSDRQNNPTKTSFSEIISDISDYFHQISNIYALKQSSPNGFLPYDEYSKIKRLHILNDQRTVDLLIKRLEMPNEEIEVRLFKYSHETLHPFSTNPVHIFVPSVEIPNSRYLIKSSLSDLRKPRVIENSLDALAALGDYSQRYETVRSFSQRANLELTKIRKTIWEIKNNRFKSPYSISELENLCTQIEEERENALKIARLT